MPARKRKPPVRGRVISRPVVGLGPQSPTAIPVTAPNAGWVTFYSPDRKPNASTLTCLLNTAGGQPVSGGPQYDVSPRVLRTGVAEYTGHDPIRMTVSILLDGTDPRNPTFPTESVQPSITFFYNLANFDEEEQEMPRIRLYGSVPHTDRRWVMDGNPTWDTDPDPIRNATGELVRQPLTINLLEAVEYKFLQWSDVNQKKKGKQKAKRFHEVKKGENDLGDVSRAEYGTRTRAAELAQLNSIDIGAKLKRGQKIRLLP